MNHTQAFADITVARERARQLAETESNHSKPNVTTDGPIRRNKGWAFRLVVHQASPEFRPVRPSDALDSRLNRNQEHGRPGRFSSGTAGPAVIPVARPARP